MSIQTMKKINDRLLFNFLAKDRQNVEEVLEAANGFVVPGITAAEYPAVLEAAQMVKEMKEVSPVVSVGLGGNGDPSMWRRVVDIAVLSNPGHINQPFEKFGFASGIVEQAGEPQFSNALVVPSGQVGIVKLTCGIQMNLPDFVKLAKDQGIVSIKVMPVKGTVHLEELIEIARVAAENSIYGIEPAGGINAENVKEIVNALLQTEIPFVMPHIFGSTIDKETNRTRPEKVREIVEQFI